MQRRSFRTPSNSSMALARLKTRPTLLVTRYASYLNRTHAFTSNTSPCSCSPSLHTIQPLRRSSQAASSTLCLGQQHMATKLLRYSIKAITSMPSSSMLSGTGPSPLQSTTPPFSVHRSQTSRPGVASSSLLWHIIRQSFRLTMLLLVPCRLSSTVLSSRVSAEQLKSGLAELWQYLLRLTNPIS